MSDFSYSFPVADGATTFPTYVVQVNDVRLKILKFYYLF